MKSEQEWKIELQDILEKLRNNSISEIHLENCKLDANGAKVIAKTLKENHSLITMNLSFNDIGAEGATALAEAFKENRSLTILDLTINDIGSKGAVALAEALKENRSLTTMFLTDNNIRTKGAIALAEALKVNCSLTTMHSWDNSFGAKQEKIIKNYLDRNIAFRDQLHQDVQSGDLEKTQEYIQHGAGLLSVTGKEANTPLHWAAAKGHIDIVKFLLAKMVEKKLNFEVKNSLGQTLLDLARKNKHEKIVSELAAKKILMQLLQGAQEKVTQDNNNISSPTAEKAIEEYLQQGNRFFMDEEYAESLQCYESALKLQPKHVEVLVRKGKALQKLNQLEEAKQTYQKVIAIEDKSAEKYHQRAKKQLEKIEKKQALSQQQSIPTIVSAPTESIISEREELLGRVSSKAELRKPNIPPNPATKQAKLTDPSTAIPLSRHPARVQFNPKTTSLQTNASKQSENNSKEESSEIAEEKASAKVLQ